MRQKIKWLLLLLGWETMLLKDRRQKKICPCWWRNQPPKDKNEVDGRGFETVAKESPPLSVVLGTSKWVFAVGGKYFRRNISAACIFVLDDGRHVGLALTEVSTQELLVVFRRIHTFVRGTSVYSGCLFQA